MVLGQWPATRLNFDDSEDEDSVLDETAAPATQGDEAANNARQAMFTERWEKMRKIETELARRFGTMNKVEDGRPAPADIAWWWQGSADGDETSAWVTVSLRSPATSLPALLRWLDPYANDIRFDLDPETNYLERMRRPTATQSTTQPENG
jgi:hypothetical protein